MTFRGKYWLPTLVLATSSSTTYPVPAGKKGDHNSVHRYCIFESKQENQHNKE